MKRHNRLIDFFKGNKRSVLLLQIFFSGLRPWGWEEVERFRGMGRRRAGQMDGEKEGGTEG